LDLFQQGSLKPKDSKVVSGTISSVPAAAATAAYSRILLNRFVNIPDNLAIYTDTDSVVLGKPLQDDAVGKG
jgi:hypothetical protein